MIGTGWADADLPEALTRMWVGAFGLIVGSFLNVVIHRVPRGISVVTPRSRCPGCGRLIRWHENVPVLSWLRLRGRCAGCRAPIAWRYPAVELLTGAVFIACHESLGFTPALAIALPFASALLALIFIDAELLLLPDAITLPFAWGGLALSFVSPLTTPQDALLGALVSWFALEGMNLAYKLVRGRDGFGGGDTKMMLMVGAFLGWQMALFTLVVGSFLGVVVGIPVKAWSDRRARAVVAPPTSGPEPELETVTVREPVAQQVPEPIPAPEPEPAGIPEGSDAPSRLRELLPQSLDEALPLLIVPACSLSWVIEGASPERTLAGLLAGIAVAVAIHLALRRRGLQSPLSRALPLAGALAGMPARPLPLVAAFAVLAGALALFRPKPVAPRSQPEEEISLADAEDDVSLLQSELPFGVFLGAAALVGLIWGEPLLDWYFETTNVLMGIPPA